MRASVETVVHFDLDEEEFAIWASLFKKLKTIPTRIGFHKSSFSEEEQNVIDMMNEFCGHTDQESKVNIIAEDTIRE